MSSNVHQSIASLHADFLSTLEESRKSKRAAQQVAAARDSLSTASKEGQEKYMTELAVIKPPLPKGSYQGNGAPPNELSDSDLDTFRGIVELMSAGVTSSIESQADLISMNRTMADVTLQTTQSSIVQQRKLLEQEGMSQQTILNSTTGIMGKINKGYGWVMGISLALSFLPMMPGIGGLISTACATWVGGVFRAALSFTGTVAGATSTVLQYSLNRQLSQQHTVLAGYQATTGRFMGDLSKLKNDFNYFQQSAARQTGVVERAAKQAGGAVSVASDIYKARNKCSQMFAQAV